MRYCNQIPGRKYDTYTFHAFWGTWSTSAFCRFLCVSYRSRLHRNTSIPRCKRFRKDAHEILPEARETIMQETLVCLIKLVRPYIRSHHRVFTLSFCPRVNSERFVLWAASNEEFLYKKINDKEGFVDYGATEDIEKYSGIFFLL